MCKGQAVSKFLLVEVKTETIANNFLSNDILEGAKRIVGIEAFRATDISYAPKSGLAVINDNAFKKAFLTLNVQGQENVLQIPLTRLNPALNDGITKEFDLDKLTITSCKITFPNGANGMTGVVTTEAALLGIYYE